MTEPTTLQKLHTKIEEILAGYRESRDALATLQTELATLRAESAAKDAEIVRLQEQHASKDAEIEAIVETIERRLG